MQQPKTSTSNVFFDLVSVPYHSLESSQTYATYVKDAEQSGDQELSQFFRQMQQEENQRAERAKQLLGRHISQGTTR